MWREYIFGHLGLSFHLDVYVNIFNCVTEWNVLDTKLTDLNYIVCYLHNVHVETSAFAIEIC